ncbi:hypothetical protein Tco_1074642 [Tanacetum coccineum]
MIYCFINNVYVDYAKLLWEGLHYSLMHPSNLIPYPRVENDDLVKNIFNSGKNKDGARMKIPDWMLTNEIKLTNHYRMYAAIFWVDRVEDEELGQMLDEADNMDVDALMDDVLNSQEATDTRIDLESYKESLKAEKDANMVTTHDEEVEEESAGDKFELKKREKGKGIEDTKDTSPFAPIRSHMTHISPLSLDKETLKELIVIIEDAPLSPDKEKLKELTNTDPSPSSSTPSSSLPNPKTGRFKRCKSFIHQMGGCYGLLFGHLTKTFTLKKNFNQLSARLYEALKEMLPSMVNKIAKMTVLIYVAEGLLLERQKNQVNTAAMIIEAIQKERENLYAEIKFEKITTTTTCRSFATRLRDHDDYQDDDAYPEGKSSAKRQKTSEHGIYSLGESSSGQTMENELNLSRSGEEHQYHLDQMQNYLKSDIVWESRKERLSLPTQKKKALVVHSCQRDSKALPMTLLNEDLFCLKFGNSG